MADMWIQVENSYLNYYFKDVGLQLKTKVVCELEDLWKLCNDVWYIHENAAVDMFKVTHGNNPEQCIEIYGDELNQDNICSRGHSIKLCHWAAEVIKRNHGPIDEP